MCEKCKRNRPQRHLRWAEIGRRPIGLRWWQNPAWILVTNWILLTNMGLSLASICVAGVERSAGPPSRASSCSSLVSENGKWSWTLSSSPWFSPGAAVWAAMITEAVKFGDFLHDAARVQAADVGIRPMPKSEATAIPSVTEHAVELDFLKQLRGKTARLHVVPYEDGWASDFTSNLCEEMLGLRQNGLGPNWLCELLWKATRSAAWSCCPGPSAFSEQRGLA